MGHDDRINSVKWIFGCDLKKETEIVSCGADHQILVWTLEDDDYNFTILEGHTENVNIVDGYYKEHSKKFAVVTSVGMDNTVRIWVRLVPGGKSAIHLLYRLSYLQFQTLYLYCQY